MDILVTDFKLLNLYILLYRRQLFDPRSTTDWRKQKPGIFLQVCGAYTVCVFYNISV